MLVNNSNIKSSLTVALNQNREIIGDDYDNLGKTVGWLGTKAYLSYERLQGWKIVQLNVIQQLFRFLFGVYSSTHLEIVARKLHRLQIAGKEPVAPTVSHIISNLWQRAYPTKPLPHSSVAFGNVNTLNDAQVICFADVHGKTAVRKNMANYINRYYRPGDIILIEGLEVGATGTVESFGMTQDIQAGIIAEGWEPKGFEEFLSPIFQQHKKKRDDLLRYVQNLIDAVPNEFPDLEQDLITFINTIRGYDDTLKELTEYFIKSKDEQTEFIEKFHKIINVETLSETISTTPEKTAILKYIIYKIMSRLERLSEKALYHNLPEESNQHAFNGFDERNHSLCEQIRKYVSEGRRVFVIAGMAHLMEFHNHPIAEVGNTLDQYPHAIIALHDFIEHNNFIKNKLALKSIPLERLI